MKRWLFLTGGLLIWGIHFGAVYAVASVADVIASADVPAARWATAALTLAALAANGLLLAWSIRGPAFLRADPDAELAKFWRSVAGLGAAVSFVSVAWQGLPALIGH